MAALIDQLFTKSQSDAIRELWEDTSCRRLLQKEIGKKILENNNIINELPLTQIMLVTSLSPFAQSEKECNEIAEILYWGIGRVDILPMLTEHQGKELAYRCLISLSLFKSTLYKRCNRYGSPSPDFYRNAGIQSFNRMGMKDIGHHFYQWEGFLGEVFAC